MDALRDTMKGLVRGAVITRVRDDLRPGVLMATSGRHSIFFEADEFRLLVVRVLHDSMDYRRHLNPSAAPDEGA
jgi:plasmid stabilization system protein ParE